MTDIPTKAFIEIHKMSRDKRSNLVTRGFQIRRASVQNCLPGRFVCLKRSYCGTLVTKAKSASVSLSGSLVLAFGVAELLDNQLQGAKTSTLSGELHCCRLCAAGRLTGVTSIISSSSRQFAPLLCGVAKSPMFCPEQALNQSFGDYGGPWTTMFRLRRICPNGPNQPSGPNIKQAFGSSFVAAAAEAQTRRCKLADAP